MKRLCKTISALAFVSVLLLLFQVTPTFSSTIVFGDAFGPTDTVSNNGEILPGGVDILMEFAIIPGDMASVTITNDSTSLYAIRMAYFNTASHITGLTINEIETNLIDPAAFPLWSTIKSNKNVNGYGTFDWELRDGGTKDIEIGQSFTWVFDVVHTGVLSDTDFTVANTEGWFGAVHAIDGTTGFAATSTITVIPEPASLLFLGSGLTGLIGLRRKFK